MAKSMDSLIAAVENNRLDIVAALLDNGADLHSPELYLLNKSRSSAMVRFLVSRGLNPDGYFSAPGGYWCNRFTPLHSAVTRPNAPEMIHALLEAGADINIGMHKDEAGEYGTPLDEAVCEGVSSAVIALLEAGAKLELHVANEGDESYLDHLVMILYPEGREDLIEKYVRLGHIDRQLKEMVDARLKAVLYEQRMS